MVSVFWGKVSKLLSEVLQIQFILTPELAILDLSLSDIPSPLKTVTQHILIGARFVIAQRWNSQAPLPISEVIR